jgi:hypothetical protein
VNWTFKSIPTVTRNGQALPSIQGLFPDGGGQIPRSTDDMYFEIPNSESILIWGTMSTPTADVDGLLKVNFDF